MKHYHLIALAVLFLAKPAQGARPLVSGAEVFESEPYVTFSLQRIFDTQLLQTVDYRTQDDTALAGVHYVATTGTVAFAAGQKIASVQVPLIDNGLADGPRTFRLVTTDLMPGTTNTPPQNLCDTTGGCCPGDDRGIIRDNELGTHVDPLFVPAASPDYAKFVTEMPDGRILISGGRDGIAMLLPDGRLDPGFVPAEAVALGNGLTPLHVFRDGRILARAWIDGRLVRLLPNGTLDQGSGLPSVDDGKSSFAGAQPDGKLLLFSFSTTTQPSLLYRVNSDGSRDTTFTEAVFASGPGPEDFAYVDSVAVQSDGKILVGGVFRRVNDVARSSLARLNPDGSLDNAFTPLLVRSSVPHPVEVRSLLLRRNGKIIIQGQFDIVNGVNRCCIAQLNPDGSLDSDFNPNVDAIGDPALVVEQPDGRLIFSSANGFSPTGIRVMRLNENGSVDPTFAVNVHALWSCRAGKSNHALALTASGQVLFSDWYTEVDGFPGSFVRLLDMPPTNDFRVVRPTEFYRATGLARIRVVRTGATTNAAAVSFRTSDDTAKAGEDYESQSGTLNFAPLEVSKEIMVPLRTRTPVEDRLVVFKLELRNPSAGYSAITATPITIVPVLRIASDLVQVRGNSVTLTLHGTQPRVRYTLESSTDLKNWQWIAENEAVGSALVFNAEVSDTLPRFYRAIRH